jgi:hypothetical protein
MISRTRCAERAIAKQINATQTPPPGFGAGRQIAVRLKRGTVKSFKDGLF